MAATKAGKFSRQMQTASIIKTAQWGAGCLAGSVLALVSAAHQVWNVAGAAAIAAAVCFMVARHHATRAGKQGIGASSEKQVSAALRGLGGYYVVDNCVWPGARGDTDHLLLHPIAGVCAIETKSGGGQVRLGPDGKSLVTGQGRVVPGDPIQQVRDQASALARHLGGNAAIPVAAVVVFPWMQNKPFRVNGVWICSPKNLPDILARTGSPRLTQASADYVMSRLRR
jgi:Nuclease-related domain